ncbi:MAG: PrsW family glutamic-type intramembrane protease, partial [Anaerolineae bacterium]
VLATGLAIVIEVILVALLALAAALIVALTPGGSARLETLVAQLSRPEVLSDPAFLQSLLSSPLVLIGAGLVIALGAPLIEEFSKSVGVVLIAAGRARLTPGEAFLWGVAAGAGFAITETMFNVVTVLPAWGGPLMLRSATAVVHCLAAGLMGLAWQAWLSGERRWRLPALYGLAVVIHGLWNGVAGLASVLQAQGTLNANLLVGAGGTLLVFALAGLFVINSGLFVYIGRRLGQPPVMALAPLPVESTVTPEV